MDHHIEVASSNGSLSSAPNSPEQGNNNTTPTIRALSGHVGVANTSSPTPTTSTTTTPRLTAAGLPRKKPGPKPKPKDPNAPEKKPRKSRKTAETKEIAAEPVTRKRRGRPSLESYALQQSAASSVEETKPLQPQPQSSHQQSTAPTPPQTRISDIQSASDHKHQPYQTLSSSDHLHNNPNLSHINVAAPSTPTPRPASSGQRYDPIRGGMFETKPQTTTTIAPPPISPPLNRASASPSITSLIDPPSSVYSQTARLQQHNSITSAPASPAAVSTRPPSLFPHQDQQTTQQQQHPHATQPMQPQNQPPHQAHSAHPVIAVAPTPMDIDSDANSKTTAVAMRKTDSSTGMNSNAPTPPTKPIRQKEAPPPLPTGSGLLSGTPFGITSNGANGTTDTNGVNIYLTFQVKGQQNVTINFAQEVEKKYGFAALHPKIAARRERMKQVTAAGLALERAAGAGSNDDMSLDMSEGESNVEMGGMEDEAPAADGVRKRKKRKQEDYDKEDDFIDDTELAWEQSALMAKDGFFVYSGPLLTEGEKPAVERADGTVKRGRGRGRGGTTRGETSGRGRGRGGGPGSRGGNVVRKPRVTKAERALMEQEKHEREKLGAAIAAKHPVGYAGTSTL